MDDNEQEDRICEELTELVNSLHERHFNPNNTDQVMFRLLVRSLAKSMGWNKVFDLVQQIATDAQSDQPQQPGSLTDTD